MTTTTAPDDRTIAAQLAALGVTSEPLGCCSEHPDRDNGFALPDRLVDGRRVWAYAQRYDDGPWEVCTGTYPGPGRRILLDVADLGDPAQVAAAVKAAVEATTERA
jgi:hypothetical protein